MKEDVEKLHPILNAATKMVIDLYERERTERTRNKLIALEKVLRENLDKLSAARAEGENQG